MERKYCNNCSQKYFCSRVVWVGSDPLETIYQYVNSGYDVKCLYYKRKWWKFWIKDKE